MGGTSLECCCFNGFGCARILSS